MEEVLNGVSTTGKLKTDSKEEGDKLQVKLHDN